MSVGGTTIEILKSLEGQPLKKWDCPSEIGTVGNYSGTGLLESRMLRTFFMLHRTKWSYMTSIHRGHAIRPHPLPHPY